MASPERCHIMGIHKICSNNECNLASAEADSGHSQSTALSFDRWNSACRLDDAAMLTLYNITMHRRHNLPLPKVHVEVYRHHFILASRRRRQFPRYQLKEATVTEGTPCSM